MLKLVALIFIFTVVYLMLFRSKRVSNSNNNRNNSKKEEDVQELVECSVCGVYQEKKDSIYSNTKWYCSKECLLK
jgi:uncharacterized protein